MRETLKKILPVPALNVLRESRDALARLKDWPAATFHPWRRDTRSRLAALHNSRAGQRCFILGNGPSLRQTDLSKLRNEATIGLNRIFLAFPEMGFQTSYLVSINDLVIEQSAVELQSLAIPRFFAWRAHRWLQPADDLFFLYTTYTGPRFARDVRGRLWEGATVTYVALQLAFYLGFETVILIGVDHNFVTQGKPTPPLSRKVMTQTTFTRVILARDSAGSCLIWIPRNGATCWPDGPMNRPAGAYWTPRWGANCKYLRRWITTPSSSCRG